MPKTRIKYVCSNCGYISLKWMGKCPSCSEWNTLVEEIDEQASVKNRKSKKSSAPVIELNGYSEEPDTRLPTGIEEFDRVLGGGIISGSVVLIGGEPGIGKSTLVLQAASGIQGKVLYVTGEESVRQLNLRSKRCKLKTNNLLVMAETDVKQIRKAVKETNPYAVIIDSIQTMFDPDMENPPGTVTQIRESASYLQQAAKENNCCMILVGHVTKDGFLAGPKVLEHIVDTVLQFEGERNHTFRILRAYKNRYGSTNEIGIFDMRGDGLYEVKNPSEIFLSEKDESISGSVVTATIEGTRPVLLEVQALLTPSNFGNPQRVTTGFDGRRLSILLAVLEKRAELHVASQNVFLNIAGGLRIEETAVDLAVCLAVASSLLNTPLKKGFCAFGEVGLGGEIRSVSHIEKRIQEAEKLGFKELMIPKNNLKSVKGKSSVNLIPAENISEAVTLVL